MLDRQQRKEQVAAWMLAALALAGLATLAVVVRYPYPDLPQGYGALAGLVMVALSIVGFLLLRRERKRQPTRPAVVQTIIWTSAFFLVLVAPTCIGTLASRG